MKHKIIALLLSLAAMPCYSAEATSLSQALANAAERFTATAEAQGVVGSSLYFVNQGDVVHAEHYGFADVATDRRVDEDTIYHWASITKTLTAVAAMQLVERGQLSLDESVADYLPEIKSVHNPFGPMDEITVGHLITHSSGFRGSTFPWGSGKAWYPHEPAEWSQVAAMMPYTEILFKPGSAYSYSNPGISMLGRIIEEISGEHIEVYLSKNILMPLGMSRSYFDMTPPYLLKYRSNNYLYDGDTLVAQGLDFDTGATVANGGLNAPVGDMVKWLNFLSGVNVADGNILPRQTLEKMWQPLRPTNEENIEEQMGMGFFIIDHPSAEKGDSRRFIGHTGSQKAFTAFVYFDPK